MGRKGDAGQYVNLTTEISVTGCGAWCYLLGGGHASVYKYHSENKGEGVEHAAIQRKGSVW
jgi:hypothetical protein